MTGKTTLAAAGLLLCGTLVAAPPAPAGKTTGGPVVRPASGELVRSAGRPFGPRAAAFVTDLNPDARGVSRAIPVPPVPAVTVPDAYEMVVYALHRPVRVRVTVSYEGKTLAERWLEGLRKAFDYFDRDGDGTLNGFEVQFIFSDAGLAQLLQSGSYAPAPQNTPALDALDLDGDRRVSFPEFVAYYKMSAGSILRAALPVAENPLNTQVTEALFKLLDRNGDGKLTRDELAAVEKLIATRDSDEDECLSISELLPAPINPNVARFPVMDGRPNGVPQPPQNIAVFEGGRIPGTVTQKVLKQYDKDGDFELTLAESGFDPETFARLDADGNGKLNGDELDAWRTGPADLELSLTLAPKAVGCLAKVVTDPATVAARGFALRQVENGRLVVRSGRQSIDFWAFVPVTGGTRATLKQQFAGLFTAAAGPKGYIEEKDLYGPMAPQLQFIRVVFDPADANADGRLTRDEFDRYFDLQQVFVDIGMNVVPTVQTPSLFQLLDENRDGRLGVRELRTAFDRLIVLEPSGTTEVTKAAIQPAFALRLTRTAERFLAFDAGPVTPPTNPAPQKGPLWFRKMDRNGDGDVSRTEFLGTKEEFDAIDTDGDGLISLDEAEAYDRKTRKDAEKK